MKNTESAGCFVFLAALLIIFIAPFVFVQGLYDYVILPQSAVIQVSFSVLTGWYLLTCLRYQIPIQVKKHLLNAAVLFFLIWTLLSCFHAHNQYEAFRQWGHWAACGVVFFLLQQLLVSLSRIYLLVYVVYVAGVLIAVIGTGQHLFLIDVIPQAVAPAATFANKNMAAQFMTLTFPLGFVLFSGTARQSKKWLAVCGSTVMLVFLSYTQTRAAWVAVGFELILLVGVGLALAARKKQPFWSRKRAAVLTGALLVFLLGSNLGPDGFDWQAKAKLDRAASILDISRQMTDVTAASAPDIRLAIWKNTLAMIWENPVLGVGLGNHKLYYPKFHSRAVKENLFSENYQLSHVHNDFLQLLSETGLVGGVAAMFVFGCFFAQIANRWSANRWKEDHGRSLAAAVGIGVAMAGILVNSCFSFPFEMPIPPLLVAVYMACIMALPAGTKGRCIYFSGRWGVLPAVMFFVLVIIGLVWYYHKAIPCDRYYQKARQAEAALNWPAVIEHAGSAYTLNPHRKKLLSYAARGYIETGQFQKGVEALEHVVQAYPYHMNAILNLGVAYTGLQQFEKALAAFRQALDIKPDFSKAHINMGGIYMGQKEYENAADAFEKGLENDPENPVVLYNLGICRFYLNAYESAAKTLQKVVALAPDMVNAQLNLAILYYQYLHQPEKSIPHFKAALRLQPNIQNRGEIQKIIQQFSAPESSEFSHD